MAKDKITLHASAAETTTGSTTPVVMDGTAGVAYINCTAASGTTPTLDVDVEAVAPDGNATVLYSFAQLVTTGSERVALTSVPDRMIRLTYTITGTTPSFTFTVDAVTN